MDAAQTEREQDHLEAAMEELIRRARLQAGELSMLTMRLEQLRRQLQQHQPAMTVQMTAPGDD